MNRFAVIAAVTLAGCAPAVTTPSSTPASDPGRSTTMVGQAGVMITTYHDHDIPVYDLNGSPDALWSVLPSVYEDLNVRMGTSDPGNRVYGNTSFVVNRTLGGKPLSTYLSCGSDPIGLPLADKYRVSMSLLTTLAPAQGGKTQVKTQLSATASNPAVSDAGTTCSTTGLLEREIASRIQAKLALQALKQ
ncbi:MAG: hypothetical protein JO040_11715 [Gemmatimonadetes bacterium]|nr:hypothetical protein [Gemmatimonadota bacterium]